EELACTFREFEAEMPVVYFKKKIPLNEILSILREYERNMVRDDRAILKDVATSLKGDVVRLEELERATGVGKRDLRDVLSREPPAGYVLVGDELVRVELLEKLRGKLRGGMRYSEAVALLREHGIRSENALRHLGFKVVWRGINPEKATLVREN
ncbi:MAG: hypothetical protein ACXQTZ_02495, partial [Candidatus Alkanophagales archaeon]